MGGDFLYRQEMSEVFQSINNDYKNRRVYSCEIINQNLIK